MKTKHEGVVKWYKEEKGYGRILLNGQKGKDVFIHFSEILPDQVRFPNGYRFLTAGQKVLFDLIENPQIRDVQRKTATNVEIIAD